MSERNFHYNPTQSNPKNIGHVSLQNCRDIPTQYHKNDCFRDISQPETEGVVMTGGAILSVSKVNAVSTQSVISAFYYNI